MEGPQFPPNPGCCPSHHQHDTAAVNPLEHSALPFPIREIGAMGAELGQVFPRRPNRDERAKNAYLARHGFLQADAAHLKNR